MLLFAVLLPLPASGQTAAPSLFSNVTFTAADQPAETAGAGASRRRSDDSHTAFGVKFGPVFSTLSGPSFSNRSGVLAGIFIGGNRRRPLTLVLEVLYAWRGAATQTSQISAHYIEIPLLFRLHAGGLYVVFGPALDLKLSTSGLPGGGNYAGTDFGVVVGGGFVFSPFLIEVRETIGLRNVFGAGGDVSAHSRAFAVLFGIKFR